jgi:uncharacterized damage-inducible protein DinB
LTQPVEGSGWPSLKNALFHIVAAWDGWICEQTGTAFEDVGPEEITTWDELDAMRSNLRPLLRRIIDETPDERFEASQGEVRGRPGASPRDIVAHILLHERAHHGDVSTLFSALDLTLPPSDYLVFVFARASGNLRD